MQKSQIQISRISLRGLETWGVTWDCCHDERQNFEERRQYAISEEEPESAKTSEFLNGSY